MKLTNAVARGVVAFLLCAGVAFAGESQGLLEDGEFNLPTPSTDVTNSAWVLDANSPDGIDLSTRFQFSGFSRSDGAGGDGGGVWYRSFEGNQGGSGEPLAESTLTQSIAAPSSGDYILSVDWAREVNFTAETWGVSLSSSSGDSVSVDLLTATSVADGNFNQILSQGGPNVADLVLNGINAGDSLTVTATMTGGMDVGGSQSAFLDNFNLRLVPEPNGLAITLAGVVGLLGVYRRRR